jgi:hypothetical protein
MGVATASSALTARTCTAHTWHLARVIRLSDREGCRASQLRHCGWPPPGGRGLYGRTLKQKDHSVRARPGYSDHGVDDVPKQWEQYPDHR